MSLRSLLRKEAYWSRRHALGLAFVLLVLPGFFAASSLLFQDVIPRNTPVAVVPQDDTVSNEQLALISGGLGIYADPVSVDDERRARDLLRREAVYAIIEVPPGVDEAGNDVTFRLTVDGSIVPFKEPSKAIGSLLAARLDSFLDANVDVERRVVGADHDLSAYLLPIALLVLLMLFAFTYVPYTLAAEAPALDRIRLSSSLEALVGAKLASVTLLAFVPIVAFQGAIAVLGYDVDALAPAAVLALLLTFLMLAAISMAVTVVTRFGSTGRILNAVLFLGALVFSGLAYPVGYFSPLRKAIVRLMPTHYGAIVTRSAMLKDASVAEFGEWLLALAGVAVASLVVLELAVVYYRRSSP